MEFNLNEVQKQRLREYILLMLGAPVLKIELDQTQVDLAIDISLEMVKGVFKEYPSTKESDNKTQPERSDDQYKTRLTYKGALAHAKIMLGRIRTKYKKSDVPGMKPSDGKILLAEGREELIWWEEELMDYKVGNAEENKNDE